MNDQPEHDWRAIQARRLAGHLRHARTSPLYRGASLPDPREITASGLDAVLAQLPVTTKDHLASAGPGAWAVPLDQVAEWVSTSGTLGKPMNVPLTRSDLERLAENEAAALALAGIRPGSPVLLAVGMDRQFIAGLAYWLGAQRLGAACLRLGPRIAEHPQSLVELATRLPHMDSAFLIAVPSYLVNLEPPPAPLAGIIAIGEPIRSESPELPYNHLGARLHQRFGCPILSTCAMTETCTTFAEGPLCRGGHLNPHLAIAEIVDDSGNSVPDGQIGELVVTPLGVQAMPLLRFATGDLAALHTGPCPCGRNTPRLGPIVSRKKHLLKFKGVNLYPQALIDAVRAAPAISEFLLIADHDEHHCDRITLHLVASQITPADHAALESRLRAILRVLPEIRYITPVQLQSLQSASSPSRKTARFIDRRPG